MSESVADVEEQLCDLAGCTADQFQVCPFKLPAAVCEHVRDRLERVLESDAEQRTRRSVIDFLKTATMKEHCCCTARSIQV